MAAGAIDKIRAAMAEGNGPRAADMMKMLRRTDKAVAATPAFRDLEEEIAELGKRVGPKITAAMTPDDIKATLKKEWAGLQTEIITPTKPGAAPPPAGTKDLPADVKAGKAGKGKGAAAAAAKTSAAATPTPSETTPLTSPVPAGNPSPGTSTPRIDTGAAAKVTASPATSATLTPEAATLAEQIAPGVTTQAASTAAKVGKAGKAATSSAAEGLAASVPSKTLTQLAAEEAAAMPVANMGPYAQSIAGRVPTTPLTAAAGEGPIAEGLAAKLAASANPPLLGPSGRVIGAAQSEQLLSGLPNYRGAGSLSNATTPLMEAQAAQMAKLTGIAGELESASSPLGMALAGVKATPRPGFGFLPSALANSKYLTETGELMPLAERLSAAGGIGGLAIRGLGGLAAAQTANQLVIDPLAKATGLNEHIAGGLKGATLGGAAGATLGAPLFGIGAVPGGLIGAGIGGLIGALSGGGGGAKGNFDESSMLAIPYLSDSDKQALIGRYRMSLFAGVPKSQAQDEAKQTALKMYDTAATEKQQYDHMLPNIMAIQGMAAGYAKPYYDDYKSSNDAQHAMAASAAASLPENQRAAALSYNDQRYNQNNQTAAAFGQAHLLSPAFYLQDALKQNAYSSGQPPLGGLGLSGALGTQGTGGGSGMDLTKLLAASGGKP